ncbi:hypothetical protein [Shewanella algae]|uniref:hypothetical protein n=1 Tax=Shewanella algae TaxID=38313 RepID=UPI001AACCED4|nr:hypothetical protein [Shewanella algae]MBO2558966.1 hypothetical protein [Shewanella algae]MBO2575881.1 hypothetical protein [Shewanella algae]
MISIINNGQAVASTDFWDCDHAKKGFFFLSWNAGAARLLIPDAQTAAISDMTAAREVIISRGRLADLDALELLFEDDSDSPYAINLLASMADRVIPSADQGGGFVVTLWTRTGQKGSIVGRYREVGELPCLQPWESH